MNELLIVWAHESRRDRSPHDAVDFSMRSAIAIGVLLAAVAALAFGVTTPVIAWAGAEAGPLSTASLLYAGAAFAALAMRLRGKPSGTPLSRRDLPRMIAIAIAGAAIAPVCLAWGIGRAGATTGSLILNFEAVITVVLAWSLYREHLGRRVIVALVVMTAAGALLVFDASARSSPEVWGLAAVAVATVGWAVDNTLTRALAERDPLRVIAAKAGLGAVLTGALAITLGEPLPGGATIGALLVCGATGYGVSLRLYLLAQRRIGAARTGSVFALAPFVGAGIAWALGDRSAGWPSALSAIGFGIGVYLHASERHAHHHVHAPTEHEHAHRHDDGHHDHVHDPSVVGEHTHRHTHDEREHSHAHAPDLHHDHPH